MTEFNSAQLREKIIADAGGEPKLFREILKKDWWKYLELALYSTLVGVMISVHAPWFDEIQAWLLARDANPFSLLFQYLRYEGSPGLWQLLLMIPAKLHLPLIALNITAGVIMAVAAYLVIFRSPFPKIIKILLPFSYFFLYQYAVVARSYCMICLLLFLIAMIYNEKNERPYAYFTLIILLACVSLHGTVIALSLLALHLFDLKRNWSKLSSRQRKGNIVGLVVYVLTFTIIVIIMVTPDDLHPVEHIYSIKHFLHLCIVTFSQMLTSYWYLFIPLFVILLAWFYKRKLLLTFLIIILPLYIFFSVAYVCTHHLGIVFFLLVFLLWLSFDEPHRMNERTMKLDNIPFEKVVTASAVIILLVYVVFGFMSFVLEFRIDYSSSKATASYIKDNNLENKKINILGNQTAVLGYFDENIFSNLNHGHKPSFWIYTMYNYKNIYLVNKKNIRKAISDNPDYVLVPYAQMKENGYDIPGYEHEAEFSGKKIWMGKAEICDSAILYRRK